MKKHILFIALLLFLSGCVAVQQRPVTVRPTAYALIPGHSECTSDMLVLPWPVLTCDEDAGKTEAEATYLRFWRFVLADNPAGGSLPENAHKLFLDAQTTLDRALCEKTSAPAVLERLQLLRIIHDHYFYSVDAHLALAGEIDEAKAMSDAVSKASLALRTLQTLTPKLPAWARARQIANHMNGDWCGFGWAGLFAAQKPLSPIPDIWLARRDPMCAGRREQWQHQPIKIWRESSPLPLKLNMDWGKQLDDGGAPVWLLQSITLPDTKRYTINFYAFPGRCIVFVNGTEVYRKEEALPMSFQAPLTSSSRNQECIVVIHLPDGFPDKASTRHAWLASDK